MQLSAGLQLSAKGDINALFEVLADQKTMAPEQLGDGAFVGGEVVIEGDAGRDTRLLEFDHQRRPPVDEAHQIGPAFAATGPMAERLRLSSSMAS